MRNVLIYAWCIFLSQNMIANPELRDYHLTATPGNNHPSVRFASYRNYLRYVSIRAFSGIDSANRFYKTEIENTGYHFIDYLPLEGGTLSGLVSGTDANFKIGIGIVSPDAKLSILNPSTGSRFSAASFYEDRIVDAGIGANITFGGRYTGSSLTEWAAIGGIKENGTSGNYAGALGFYSRAQGAGMIEGMRLTSAGDIGIGIANPITKLSILNPSSGSKFGTASFFEDRTVAAGIGANITFGGRYSGATLSEWAAIGGAKDNATEGNNAGSLAFYTRANGGGMMEKMRLTSYGNVGIGLLNPDAKLSILNPSTGSRFAAASFYEDRAVASGVGANISFGGRYTGSAVTEWAGIGGVKENGNDGNYAGALALYTRADSAGMAEIMRLTSNGKVGIGLTSPDSKLSVLNPSTANRFATASFYEDRIVGTGIGANITFGGRYSGSSLTEWAGIGGSKENGTSGNYAGSLGFYTRADGASLIEGMRLTSAGKVGIGTSAPSEKLSVNGNISARKLIVTQTGWSDYVFDKDYKLRSLQSLESFITQNKHLPEVPTAKEVKAKGISVGDTQALLLKKIEELTLYLIQQDKKIERVIVENQKLKQILKNNR